MLDRIEFQRKVTETGNNGRLHTSKLASVIFDLVEDHKANCKMSLVKKEAECSCQQSISDITARELKDSISGLAEGFKSLNMKIDEIENKIELMSKTRKLKTKDE